ncbi:ISKra4 family transposase [Lusitaniella coriacea]|uniref:ISKra4 family transposase n=1 Tax=Lusitaniella coriacea TaxID=1983105 RepID=UPI003CF0CD06
MTPEKQAELNTHLDAIAKILYSEADPQKRQNLEGIEEVIRTQTLNYIAPHLGFFFVEQATGTKAGRGRKIKSIIGELRLTEKQAIKLNLKSHTRISPYLEKCCLRASANVSYENASRDLGYYTGMTVSPKTQQRIVHQQSFPEAICQEKVEEISLDGGKVRLRTPELGKSCIWRDYKAVCVNRQLRKAWFRENSKLIDWVNQQPLSSPLNCLGDGHPGIWKIVEQWNCPGEKKEILDWFHLMENLHKVGGSIKRLKKAESLLWLGKVDATLKLISTLTSKQARNFCRYVETHRERIINYYYYQQEEICSIASGAVESTVKQIDRRLKISGAQWNFDNIPQVLKHRCAYLNDTL